MTMSFAAPSNEYTASPNNGPGISRTNTYMLRNEHQLHEEISAQPTRTSTKALAITSCASAGPPPPPLIGSAIVLANDSAMHCFGGRLEDRTLTNCHYVLDLETSIWETVHAAPLPPESTDTTESETATAGDTNDSSTEKPTNISLSLATDPVDTDSGLISGVPPIHPPPRYFHTLNAFGTFLILFGGMGKAQEPDDKEKDKDEDESKQQADDNDTGNQGTLGALNDLWVFDTLSQQWQQKHPQVNSHSPRPRWAHMATIMDHYLVVIGGTDTFKVYVEDACVLDLQTWEWVATIPSIGQCGSYRTVAATGPSKQSSTSTEPAVSSFPSASASSPQTSSNLARPLTDSGPVDTMASISMVLSGRISAPSSASSSKDDDTSDTSSNKRKHSGRLLSGELTPSFRTGKDVPSIYLYSNYNFTKLHRDFKVITPHYTHPTVAATDTSLTTSAPVAPPSFSLIEKSQALNMMGPELPPGLRFPQGHVYQNQLILTGTLIVPNMAPTLAIYSFNLTLYKWERLDTDGLLETGSWNRTLLHPATGTLLVFGNQQTDPRKDYANRLQHHNHLMLIDLQAYGLYDRPIPSMPQAAQELGQELLSNPSLCDMHISSMDGNLFGANSTLLAARWPEFSSLLLSPPYVTPLILILPVPDEVVPLFLQYLYTGALPQDITPGIADYLLILARKYELNGLYALTMDILHQTVHLRSIRIYTSALLAGEMGLQARAIGLAMPKLPARVGTIDGKELPPLPSPASTVVSNSNSTGLSRSYSGRVPPPPPTAPYVKTHRREFSNQSRDSISTDGGLTAEGLLQQYGQRQLPPVIPEDDIDPRRQPPLKSPQLLSPTSLGRASDYSSPLSSPGMPQGYGGFSQSGFPSPLSPTSSFSSQQISLRGFGYDDYTPDERTLQARRRLQMQMQQEPDIPLSQHQYHQDPLLQQQQQMRDQEAVVMEQHRLQHQRYVQKQQQIQAHQLQVEQPTPAAVLDELDYHFGGGIKQPSAFRIRSPNESMRAETSSSHSGSSSQKEKEREKDKDKDKEKDKKKDKKLLSKMKPPKPTLSGAELMKSAGF